MIDAAVIDYRRRADDVEKLGKAAMSETHRQAMLLIAQKWRELADDREEYNKSLLRRNEALPC